jgi:hypothetical protein
MMADDINTHVQRISANGIIIFPPHMYDIYLIDFGLSINGKISIQNFMKIHMIILKLLNVGA